MTNAYVSDATLNSRKTPWWVMALGAAAVACSRPATPEPAAKEEGTCAEGQQDCGGSCVLLTSDPSNCGACGATCAVGMSCVDGTCSCPDTLQACQGQCRDTTRDPANCGACGVSCQTGQTCQAAKCSCQLGLTECGDQCVDLSSDGNHCGRCGHPCSAPQVCSNGVCSSTCAAGLIQCGNACVDVSVDPYHCGRCDNACPGGQSCVSGTCRCAAGQSACDGECVDVEVDANNCGACGTVCAAGQSCVAGACTGGGTPAGGTGTGGASASGGTTTGGSSDTGGISTGGVSDAGGASTGGVSTGGISTGGAPGTGGVNTGGTPATGGTNTGGTPATGGAATGGNPGACTEGCSNAVAGACAAPHVRVTEVDVGTTVLATSEEVGLMPLAIVPIPSGGSRLAWMGNDSKVYVGQLDCDDQLVGTPFSFPAQDFQDIGADDTGGVVVLTRDAQGGGTLNCGNENNLCGIPNEPVPCYDMYMIRFDCFGTEQWATKLTTSSAANPPYTAGSGYDYNYMVWWYQHHGRVAYDGTNYAAYFCDAITTANGSCVDIHQGDRMQVVGPNGSLVSGHDSFDLGCSHSGFTRIVWDQAAGHFIMVCKTDNSNRLAMPNPYRTIYPLNLTDSYVGDVVLGSSGGYWVTVSNNGTVHLLHFTTGEADQDIDLATANYPHLASYGSGRMIAFWGTGSSMTARVLDAGDGGQVGSFTIGVNNNPYLSPRSYPDGSVAYPAEGGASTIKIARVMPCSG